MKTIIHAGTLWDGLACRPLGYAEIAVVDGKISEIGKRLTHEDGVKSNRFIHAICHARIYRLPCSSHRQRNILANIAESNDADLTLAAVDACTRVLYNGFTTVRDAGDFSFVSWIVPSLLMWRIKHIFYSYQNSAAWRKILKYQWFAGSWQVVFTY